MEIEESRCIQCLYFLPFCPDLTILSDNAEVTIGHVDCTADGNANRELCSTHGVNGFPTLNIYKDGEKVDKLFL